MDPLKDAMKEAKQRKSEKVNTVSDELEVINRRHQENEEKIRKLKITIAELEAEYKGNDQEVSLGPQEVEQARKDEHLKQRYLEIVEEKKDEKCSDEGDGDMWDAFRAAAKDNDNSTNKSSRCLLPAGVLLGKYHESVIYNLQANGLQDMKEKYEKFFSKQ